jgi:hypothetical protein
LVPPDSGVEFADHVVLREPFLHHLGQKVSVFDDVFVSVHESGTVAIFGGDMTL